MSAKLKDKIAPITGGTEGIGLATPKLFAEEGTYVFIAGRRQKELDEAVRAIVTARRSNQGRVAKRIASVWRDVSCVARSGFYQYSIGDLQYAPEWRVRTEPERPRPQTGRTV